MDVCDSNVGAVNAMRDALSSATNALSDATAAGQRPEP